MEVSTLVVSAVVLVASLHSTQALKCMSCTYTFSGAHGVMDHDCVSDVYNFTKTRVIECESKFCTTKAVYVTGYTRLNSLYRGCGYKREKFCDHPSSLIPTCEVTCTSQQCNDQNGDLWPSMKPTPSPGGSGGGGGSSNLNTPFFPPLLVAMFGLFLTVFNTSNN